MKNRLKQGINGNQKEQRMQESKQNFQKSKMAFSKEKSGDIVAMKRKVVASQREHSEKKNGLLGIKNIEQKCESSPQGANVKLKKPSTKQNKKIQR